MELQKFIQQGVMYRFASLPSSLLVGVTIFYLAQLDRELLALVEGNSDNTPLCGQQLWLFLAILVTGGAVIARDTSRKLKSVEFYDGDFAWLIEYIWKPESFRDWRTGKLVLRRPRLWQIGAGIALSPIAVLSIVDRQSGIRSACSSDGKLFDFDFGILCFVGLVFFSIPYVVLLAALLFNGKMRRRKV